MSTRSRIGILRKDGSVDSVYCHSDGYPSYNGRILLESYTEQSKIEELLKLGQLSILAAEIGTSNPFDSRTGDFVCAYHRDRGEPLITFHSSTVRDLEETLRQSDQEWCYLYSEAESCWRFSPVTWNWDYSNGKRQKLPDRPFAWKKLTTKDCKRD